MKLVAGLDEVGRGALAGPLVLCLVEIDDNLSINGIPKGVTIRDSKKMTRIQRSSSFEYIKKVAKRIDIEVVSVSSINDMGIGKCNHYGFEKLIGSSLSDSFIVDGNLKFEDTRVKSIIKADSLYLPVMMAGIVAKVTRDKIMKDLHLLDNRYCWNKNVGYGTLEHLRSIDRYGKTKHHRDLFVKTAMSNFRSSLNPSNAF